MTTGTITSLGIGSSLDLQGILDSLREAEEVSITSLENEVTEQSAIKDEYNVINAKLLTMKTNASNLSLSSNYLAREVSVSSTDVVSATAVDGTATGTYAIETSRLATQSSFLSVGKSSSAISVYVPTVQNSANGFDDTDTTLVLEEDEEMTITYGSGDDRKIITITGDTGGMTMDDLITAINTDAGNNDGQGSTYVTASSFEGEDGLNYLTIAATSGGTGEDNRVMVTIPPASTGFTAEEAIFSYSLGDASDTISLSVSADTSLEDLADLINDDENNPGVTASVINTGIGQNAYKLVIKSDNTGEDARINILTGLDDLVLTEENGAGFSMEADTAVSFTDPIIITAANGNNTILFQEDTGSGYTQDLTATIADGVYQDADDLTAAIEEAMEAASLADGSGIDYLVSYNETSGKISIQEAAGTLENLTIKWGDAGTTAAAYLGFTETKTLTPADSSLNATVTVDGIAYQRQENTGLSDIIDGVTLSLLSAGSASIGVTSETGSISDDIKEFVNLFNDLIAEIDANDDYDEDEGTWGTLAKSSSIRSVKDTLLSILSTPLDTGTDIQSLFDLGLEIERDGTISLDEDTLAEKIGSNFEDIGTLFLGDDTFTGLADRLNTQLTEYTLGSGGVSGLIESETGAIDTRISRLEKDIEEATERLDKKYETLALQYAELDSYMSEMESQQNYISQIFSATEDS